MNKKFYPKICVFRKSIIHCRTFNTKTREMTKTSIFGQSEVKQDEKKPIEFVKCNIHGKEWSEVSAKPNEYNNITLLEKNYGDNLDLMWAYEENPNYGTLYLGHWNDGIA